MIQRRLLSILGMLVLVTQLARPGDPRVVLFDQAHGQFFSPLKSDGLNYSLFASLFTKAGFQCRTSQTAITKQSLKNVSAYVVNGAFRSFDPAEIAALDDYVHAGGRIVILLQVSEPVARLTESFGIVVSNVPVRETDERALIDRTPLNFVVHLKNRHFLTEGGLRIAFYGVFALLAEGAGSTILASTSRDSYADLSTREC